MIAGFVVELAVGLLCVIFGLLIWLKQKVSLLHDYHYSYVKSDDIPMYTRLVGIGLIVTGIGVCISGVFILVFFPYWWIPLLVGIPTGLTILCIAQKKYNGSVLD